MKNYHGLMLFTLLVCVCGFAQAVEYNPAGGFPIDKNVSVGRLDNGFTYYIRHNSIPENKVELRLVVNIGSILEQDNERGLSHFLEHMAFNGSPRFPRGELIKRLEGVGVRLGKELNAYTSFDETVYSLPITADNLSLGLDVIEDWAMNLTLDSCDIDKERGVISEELRLGKGASIRIREKYLPVLFAGSRYPERLPIGKADVIENFPYKVLRDYYKRWYRPDMIALVVVGDIDTAAVRRNLTERFGRYPQPEDMTPREMSYVPAHDDFRTVLATDPETSGTSVEISYKHKPLIVRTQRDYVRQNIYDDLFSYMINGRLDEIAAGEQAPFSEAEAGYSNYFRGVDTYSAYARCTPAQVAQAVRRLAVENERIVRYGFIPVELQRAKDKLIARCKRIYNEREKFTSERYADEYQVNFLSGRPIPGIEFEYQIVEALLPTITIDSVNCLAEQYMPAKSRTIVVTGPQGETIVYPTEQELVAIVEGMAKEKIKPYSERRALTSLMDKTPKQGRILEEKTYSETGITEWKLSNGATVVFKPTTFKNNEILFRSTSNGGYSMFPAEDDMSALYATKIQDESGVNGINNTQLKRLLAGKNISLTQSLVLYNESMSGKYEPDDAESFFQLLYLYHTAPYFDKAAFTRVIANERAEYAKLLDSPMNFFSYNIDQVMSNGNSRRKPWPVSENIDRVNLKRAEAIYKERFGNAAGFTYVFVGNVDQERMKPYILTYIGGLPGNLSKKTGYNELNFTSPQGPQQFVYNKGVDQKVNVTLKFVKKVDWSRAKNDAYSAFVEILNSRLFESLRQQMSGVYGVRVYGNIQRDHEQEAQLSLGFGTNVDYYEALINRALVEIERLIADGPTADELSRVQEKRYVALSAEIKENPTWLLDIQKSYRNGDRVETVEQRRNAIENLTSVAIKNVGRECVDAKSVLKFILLPEVN